MRRRIAKRKIEIELPSEFMELCNFDMTSPEMVLRGFIADLCSITDSVTRPRADGFNSNGSDEREFARAYYERVGYAFHGKFLRGTSKASS